MIRFLVIAVFAVSVNGGPAPTCTVGDWSEWSSCVSSRYCPAEPVDLSTYPMEATTEWDSGRAKMEIMMNNKEEIWRHRAECRADGSCPELLAMPVSGAFPCVGGIAGDIPCLNIDQLSFLDFFQMGYDTGVTNDNSPSGNDVWGWTDPQNGDEYAIMGISGGTGFVRVTDPVIPVPVGFMYSTGNIASTWRDMKVIGNYAYIVSEARDHGLQVFDLTHLRGRTTIGYFQPDAVNNDFGNAHNIAANVDTNFLYVVGATSSSGYPNICGGGLLVIDVTNPLTPTMVGCFGGDGYVHDTQCVIYHGPDTRFTGNEICFCFNEDSFTIVDVTDKSNMYMIHKTGYVNVAYTHQGWATEDHAIVLLDDELDENGQPSDEQFTKTYIWDVALLDSPQLLGIFYSSERSIDHNQYIIGDLSYQANYESGLRILNIDRATNTLTNVGYFDVLPSSTTANFNGAWSVYPYFSSGTILISSIDYGLFMVKADMAAIQQQVAAQQDWVQMQRTREVLSSSTSATCPALVETQACASVPAQC